MVETRSSGNSPHDGKVYQQNTGKQKAPPKPKEWKANSEATTGGMEPASTVVTVEKDAVPPPNVIAEGEKIKGTGVAATISGKDALIGDANTTTNGKEVEANVMNAAKGYKFTFFCCTL
ncbi:uncharacterized protein LOC125192890 [Salvia hispanica]|uniref:uncharacterized protein LOC125192890 n=1 Tax=Salvia hispanica TaxID=49212 RepID=UPI002009CF3C|nr:uncharacterized protein LOC125192890 [Salvia hispanica]